MSRASVVHKTLFGRLPNGLIPKFPENFAFQNTSRLFCFVSKKIRFLIIKDIFPVRYHGTSLEWKLFIQIAFESLTSLVSQWSLQKCSWVSNLHIKFNYFSFLLTWDPRIAKNSERYPWWKSLSFFKSLPQFHPNDRHKRTRRILNVSAWNGRMFILKA